jgi:hypothetical protein
MSRKHVPAALRAEVSEYSSLLRALQSNNALDLASHLTKRPRVESESAVSTNASDEDSDEDTDEDRDVAEYVANLTNSSGSEVKFEAQADKGAGARRKRKRGDASQGRVRDKWTRWPLLASDVHVPEWRIEDEIKVLASQIMKAHHRSQDPAPQPTHDDELDGQNLDDVEDEILSSSYLDALTLGSSAMLSQILALLVAYVPLSEKSMQNRIVPIDSESVLNIVKTHDLFDEKSVSLSLYFHPCLYCCPVT